MLTNIWIVRIGCGNHGTLIHREAHFYRLQNALPSFHNIPVYSNVFGDILEILMFIGMEIKVWQYVCDYALMIGTWDFAISFIMDQKLH